MQRCNPIILYLQFFQLIRMVPWLVASRTNCFERNFYFAKPQVPRTIVHNPPTVVSTWTWQWNVALLGARSAAASSSRGTISLFFSFRFFGSSSTTPGCFSRYVANGVHGVRSHHSALWRRFSRHVVFLFLEWFKIDYAINWVRVKVLIEICYE